MQGETQAAQEMSMTVSMLAMCLSKALNYSASHNTAINVTNRGTVTHKIIPITTNKKGEAVRGQFELPPEVVAP